MWTWERAPRIASSIAAERLGAVDQDVDRVPRPSGEAGVARPQLAVHRRIERLAVTDPPKPPMVVGVDGSLEGLAERPVARSMKRGALIRGPTGRGRPGTTVPRCRRRHAGVGWEGVEVLARPRFGTLAVVLAAALAAAPAAQAAGKPRISSSLRADGTTVIHYVAPPGQHNELELRVRAEAIDPYKRQLGLLEDTGIDFYDIGADELAPTGPLCKPQGTGAGCDVPGTRVEVDVDLGDGDDSIAPEYDRRRQTPIVVLGGPGSDALQVWGSVPTAVDFSGGPGIDAVDYYDPKGSPFSFTNDALANDGRGHDRIRRDVELYIGGDAEDQFAFPAGGRHIVFGAGGDDTMISGPGPDELDGGYGGDPAGSDAPSDDVVSYAGRTTGVTVTLDGYADDGAPGETDFVLPTVEHVIATAAADKLVGPARVPDARAYTYEAGDGNDIVSGGAGSDLIDAGAGDDVVIALGGGTDAVKCGDGDDVAVVDRSDRMRTGARRDCEDVSHSYVRAASSQIGRAVDATVAVPATRSRVSAELLSDGLKVGSRAIKVGPGLKPLHVALNEDAKQALHKARSLPLTLRVKISSPGRKAVSGSKRVTLAEG
jgi:Ca2+-binding RTX toxin-like protein